MPLKELTMYKVMRGRFADPRLLSDRGEAELLFVDGPHNGHTSIARTQKYLCGPYAIRVECECGACWENKIGQAKNGPYLGRMQSGDSSLAPFVPALARLATTRADAGAPVEGLEIEGEVGAGGAGRVGQPGEEKRCG
jgi:hypothetical protein